MSKAIHAKMVKLMYFKGSFIYGQNITISIASLVFLVYGLLKTKRFIQFYKMKFYFVFALLCYAMICNGFHGLAVKHQVIHTTLFTEVCLFLLMLSSLLATLFWTYRYYLKFIYSLITGRYFKTLTSFIQPLLSCFLSKNKDYYEYDTLGVTETDTEDPTAFGDGKDQNLIFENSMFRYINYQVLGNYLFTQIFNVYTLSCTYLVRITALSTEMEATNQLVLLNLYIFMFVILMTFMDFKYRRFTKSFIMPHLTLLSHLGYWMFEYFDRFDQVHPEPVSTINFTLTFIYIVVKFSFLSDASFLENMDNFKLKHH